MVFEQKYFNNININSLKHWENKELLSEPKNKSFIRIVWRFQLTLSEMVTDLSCIKI